MLQSRGTRHQSRFEHPRGQDHNASLQKHNVGAGTPAAVQTLALSLRAAFSDDSGIATLGASNAFNTVSRPKILEQYTEDAQDEATSWHFFWPRQLRSTPT